MADAPGHGESPEPGFASPALDPPSPTTTTTSSPSSSPTRPKNDRRISSKTRLARANNMNGPLYMQGSAPNVVLVRRLKRKDESAWKQLSRWFVENQIGTSESRRGAAVAQVICSDARPRCAIRDPL